MAQFSNQGSSVETWIRDNQATTNFGSSDQVQIGKDSTGVQINRPLIKWDLSSIPANITVTSAILSLWTKTDLSTVSGDWKAYRVKRAWTEGGATWNKYDGSSDWSTAGCGNTTDDRESTELGSVTVASGYGVDTEVQITLSAALVQGWITGSFTNNGILLKTDSEANDQWVIHSHEAATAGLKPKLVINYDYVGGFFAGLI